MHSRNPYKTVPDFKQLALLYPDFRNVANIVSLCAFKYSLDCVSNVIVNRVGLQDLTGKVKIDFKNEECIRILTQVLLKHDFNLDVKIPPNKLIPTLPLRLNYVLWIEDLIKHSSLCNMKEAVGIDIGIAIGLYILRYVYRINI